MLGSEPAVSPARPTARGGTVTVSIADGPQDECTVTPSHLESLDVATGRERTRTTTWSDVLGELPSGELVVTNQRTAGAKMLTVAVLARRDLRPRFSCESPVQVDPRSWYGWYSADSGAIGEGLKSGRARNVYVQLELSNDSCRLTVLDEAGPAGEAPAAMVGAKPMSGSVDNLRQGALTLHDSPSPKGPSDPVLFASKGSAVMWQRALARPGISGAWHEL